MGIKITGTGIYLPPQIETSKETATLIDKSEEWIISKTGVVERRKSNIDVDKIIDVKDRFILPAWCDSHTHIVYSGSREKEFVDRISGVSYEEIAKKGGGILNSAKKLQKVSFEKLYSESAARLEEVMKLGTGAIEIKSGYGLELSAEIKMFSKSFRKKACKIY